MFLLDFIEEKDFEKQVLKTLNEYYAHIKKMNLKKFNKNSIDPIKLLFDKNIFNSSFEEVIKQEISRQIDKSNNNSIGYFHQHLFKYIKNCEVPTKGWDIIFKRDEKTTYYVELKNKHNTMNSSSSTKTYMSMQNHLLNADDKEHSICALVEVVAKKSADTPWRITINNKRQPENERLRRISIDKFYEIVTGDKLAFAKLCRQLPITIEKLVQKENISIQQNNSIFEELLKIDKDILKALYQLAFSSYNGFGE